MARNWIVIGDPTSSGGSVVTGSPFTDIDGTPVARVTDQATCPRHKGAYPIVDGDSTLIVDGQPVALHGSSLACGCKVLSAQQVRVFVDAGGGGGAGGAARAVVTAKSSAAAQTLASATSDGGYDEAFVLRSSLTGKPLANRNYRIFHANGSVENGVTDAGGATHLVHSDCCEQLKIELEEEGP